MSSPGEVATVTAAAIPCTDLYARYMNAPTLLNEAAYNLCLVTHKAGQYVISAGHWIWTEIESLWQEIENLGASMRGGVVTAGRWVGQHVSSALQSLKDTINGLFAFIDKLDPTSPTFMGKKLIEWLLIGGAIYALIAIAPTINAVSSNFDRRHK